MNGHSIALSWTVMGACLILVAPASAQEETGAESVEAPTSETSAVGPESSTEEPWPSALGDVEDRSAVGGVEDESAVADVEEKRKGPYSEEVQGKLWLEAFVGPSSYDPDRFGGGEILGMRLDAPKETGPEFGAAIGGAAIDRAYFIGGSYRQANYSNYKLLKAGLAQQVTFRMVPYVHPVLRVDLGYAHVFGGSIYPGSIFPVQDSPRHGFYFTLGAGVRVPIIRWISFLATFDWTGVGLFGESTVTSGQQLGGTFALTFHFIDVDTD